MNTITSAVLIERKGADWYDMYAHIIVGRKDWSNIRKPSPKSNYVGRKNCGNVEKMILVFGKDDLVVLNSF